MRHASLCFGVPLLVGLLFLPHCGSDDAPSEGPSAEGGTSSSSSSSGGASSSSGDPGEGGADVTPPPPNEPANVIFVLADDLAWNLVEHMPNVQQMQKDGMTFNRYYVTDSLCCPSRSSIFTGKFPHNTGVFTNSGDDGGYATFLKKGNEAGTFQVALKAAGVDTAMGGKLMNGYQTEAAAQPKGWSQWFIADNGYPNFDYDLNESGKVKSYGHTPADYLTDVMAKHGQAFVADAAKSGKTFFLEIATFAPHSPFTPAPRHANLFPNLKAPRKAKFGVHPANAPPWLAEIPDLTNKEIQNLDDHFRMRAQAVQAIDEMIGDLRKAIASDPKLKNTYVVFSSDNGFHMGDYSLREGKQTAFDTDIHVPLIVVGPGVPAGAVSENITENVDLCPTFAELAKVPAPATADGHSLVDVLHGETPTDWRDAALVEHHHSAPAADDPDKQEKIHADPPSYAALRTKDLLFVEYEGGAAEYYQTTNDPDQLDNQIGTLAPNARARLHGWLETMRACKGAAQCWAAGKEPPATP